MDTSEVKEVRKLVEKAELTRYIHGNLGERKESQRKLVQVTVALLGMLVSVVAAVYYRMSASQGIIGGSRLEEVILIGIIILPIVGTTLVILDATVWQLRDREERHKQAVGIWGDWIRMVEEVRRMNGGSEGVRELQRKYRKCMRRTPNTSMKNFLTYKREWIHYKNESIRLDQEKVWCKD